MRLKCTLAILVLLFHTVSIAQADSTPKLTAVGFNVFSGDGDPKVIDDILKEQDGVDLWGLSEVRNFKEGKVYGRAASDGEDARFRWIIGSTGRSDRLMIIYNADKLDLMESTELHYINSHGTVRAPLFARFQIQESGEEFLFMVNHLYRGNESTEHRRHEQSKLLNEWGAKQELPIIAVGDYNYDWEVLGGGFDHDKGYDNLTKNGVFKWVRPETLIKTQCSPRFNSVLDFVFVAGPAKTWKAKSEILERERAHCSIDGGSDHRPVKVIFGE